MFARLEEEEEQQQQEPSLDESRRIPHPAGSTVANLKKTGVPRRSDKYAWGAYRQLQRVLKAR